MIKKVVLQKYYTKKVNLLVNIQSVLFNHK